MAGYLPDGAFGKAPELEWLCSETDPRAGADKLRVAVVTGAPKGPPTEAMKIFSRIGWYDMAAFAVVRAGCCPEAPPLSLPDSKCDMATALRSVGEAVTATRDSRRAAQGVHREHPLRAQSRRSEVAKALGAPRGR